MEDNPFIYIHSVLFGPLVVQKLHTAAVVIKLIHQRVWLFNMVQLSLLNKIASVIFKIDHSITTRIPEMFIQFE